MTHPKGENTSKSSKTTEPSHKSIQNKTDTVPRKVAPSKRENTGKITQTRFQKCFKDFCKETHDKLSEHRVNCFNHKQLRCTETDCSLQSYHIPKIKSEQTHQSRSQQGSSLDPFTKHRGQKAKKNA